MDYDDDRELTNYILGHWCRLMTEFELRVSRAITARAKATASRSAEMAGVLNKTWGAVGDPAVETALADGPEIFRRRVRDRLLSEHAAEIFINRCPSCGRVVRTPLARQCFWCGFDWHSAEYRRVK